MDAARNAPARPTTAEPHWRTHSRPFRISEPQVVVTDDDLDQAAHSVAKQFQSQTEYVRSSTLLIGSLPIVYGLLTFVFGQALWASNPVYRTALAVPGAPQSWGTVFVVLGVLSIWFAERRRHTADTVVCMLAALVLSMFMVAFTIEMVKSDNISTMPPATVYALFSLLFMNRARLSWKSRRRR